MHMSEHVSDRFSVTGTQLTLTEVNEEVAISLPLVLRQDHDAGDIVVLLGVLLLMEGEGRGRGDEVSERRDGNGRKEHEEMGEKEVE